MNQFILGHEFPDGMCYWSGVGWTADRGKATKYEKGAAKRTAALIEKDESRKIEIFPLVRYVIVYQTDNNDLYTKEFTCKEKAMNWLEGEECKAYIIEIEGKFKIEDFT